MMDARKLQDLRNLGIHGDEAADEIDLLRAEVEALTAANAALVASNDALREDAERYTSLKSIAKVGITKRQEFVITLDLVPCPNHIGELDLALDTARNGPNNKEPTPE